MSDTLRFLPVHSEMARRIREFDWSGTPLGPPESWPQSFKAALGICLNSTFPSAIYWGPDLRLLYNDAWAPIPAERHPWALGRPADEVWADIWDVVGPQMSQVLDSGEGYSTYDQLLPMERNGRRRETYWNYSFTPIIGDDGRVAGIFNQGHEVTNGVLEKRRQEFLLRLADALRRIDDPRGIIRTAQRMLGEQLGASRVGYGDTDSSERFFTTTDNWTDGVPPRHGTHDLAGFGPEVHSNLKAGIPLVIEDVRSDPRTSDPAYLAAFEAIDTRAAVTASLVKNKKMVAALYVHSKEPRSWTATDVQLVGDVADRTWSELARARAEALAGVSEDRYRRIFEQTSDLIITADLDQVITDCNRSAAQAVGLTRAEAIGKRISDFVSPEDFAKTTSKLREKLEQGGTTRYDVRVRSGSGEMLFWEINSGLTHDESGQPVGLHVVGRDVTERKRWEHHQQLLVAELNHRVKNTLAIVQSLAHQTFRPDKPPEEAVAAFDGRLSALAAAHNLLTRENWEAASIRDIIIQALSPFCPEDRCALDGPDLRIPPQTAVSLTLALHELATNASKYGALSVRDGTVRLEWSEEMAELDLTWREIGGPQVREPTTSGFGTRMIRRALAPDLKGKVELAFRPEGVVCRIRAPIHKDELG